MTLLCVYQVSQHWWLIYLLCFRSLLRQSGPLRVSFTSLPSVSGGKLLVLPCEPPSSACWAPSLPSLPFSSWPHAALNTGISVLRYGKKWSTVHTLQREKNLFSMVQVFFQMNEHDSNTFSSDLSFSGSGVVSGGAWWGFQYPTPLQHGEKKLFWGSDHQPGFQSPGVQKESW